MEENIKVGKYIYFQSYNVLMIMKLLLLWFLSNDFIVDYKILHTLHKDFDNEAVANKPFIKLVV